MAKPKERRVNSRGGGKITQVYVNGRWIAKSLYLRNQKMWDKANNKNNKQKGAVVNPKSKTDEQGLTAKQRLDAAQRKREGITVELEGGGTHTIYPGHKDYEAVKSGQKKLSNKQSDHVSEAKNEKLQINPESKGENKNQSNGEKKNQSKSNGEKKTQSDEEKRATYKENWIKSTENSPAAKAGFSGPERWALHVKHQNWKKKKGRNHEKLAIGSKKKEK